MVSQNRTTNAHEYDLIEELLSQNNTIQIIFGIFAVVAGIPLLFSLWLHC